MAKRKDISNLRNGEMSTMLFSWQELRQCTVTGAHEKEHFSLSEDNLHPFCHLSSNITMPSAQQMHIQSFVGFHVG